MLLHRLVGCNRLLLEGVLTAHTHLAGGLLLYHPPAVRVGAPCVCAVLVRSHAWKPPTHVDTAWGWNLSPSSPVSTPPKSPPLLLLLLLLLLFAPTIVFSQTPGWLVAAGPEPKHNNWGWAAVGAVRDVEVSLDGTMLKDKLLKAVSSACHWTEGICFYTKHSVAQAPAGPQGGGGESGLVGDDTFSPRRSVGCCLRDLMLIKDSWSGPKYLCPHMN